MAYPSGNKSTNPVSILNLLQSRSSVIKFPHFELHKDLSVDVLNKDLHQYSYIIENEPKKAMSHLRGIIDRVSDANKPWLRSWIDPRGFDILQIAIVNNRVDIIDYLLGDVKLIPESHHPRGNPYAHLAASVGFKGCLQKLLSFRPSDYFKAHEPHHAVRIPTLLKQKLKLKTPGKGNVDKLMRAIKEDTALAEQILENSDDENDVFEEDIKELKASFKKKEKRKSISYKGLTPALNDKHEGKAPATSKGKAPATSKRKSSATSKYVHKHAVKRPPKPKITIFWDVFNEDQGGVVGGAGQPLEVVYMNDNDHHKHTISSLPIIREKVVSKTSEMSNKPKKTTSEAHSTATSKSSLYSDEQKDRKVIDQFMAKKQNPAPQLKGIEMGVRKIQKYKEFVPVIETRLIQFDDMNKWKDQTPLTMAAENGHVECVIFLLERLYAKSGATRSSLEEKEPLTLATKARSPEALAVLLDKQFSRTDFQSAILSSIRELYPDCLSVLLSLGRKERDKIFDATNLFHILYSQSLVANYRYEMLPEMTRVLLNCQEDVNARTPRTFPMYTLIQCVFNVNIGRKSTHFVQCLKMLLDAKANPHYNEAKGSKSRSPSLNLSRHVYSSAIQCVLSNAICSLQFFQETYWTQLIMQKLVEAIEDHDRTPRKIDNDVLFLFMDHVSELGLNRRILRALLRYGANPDHTIGGQYPLNMFFNNYFPYLTKFQLSNKYSTCDHTVDTLLILCKSMSQVHLRLAVRLFLNDHLLGAPIQALELSRKFCYHANKLTMSPRSLRDITRQFIWKRINRNVKNIPKLPITIDLRSLILP